MRERGRSERKVGRGLRPTGQFLCSLCVCVLACLSQKSVRLRGRKEMRRGVDGRRGRGRGTQGGFCSPYQNPKTAESTRRSGQGSAATKRKETRGDNQSIDETAALALKLPIHSTVVLALHTNPQTSPPSYLLLCCCRPLAPLHPGQLLGRHEQKLLPFHPQHHRQRVFLPWGRRCQAVGDALDGGGQRRAVHLHTIHESVLNERGVDVRGGVSP